MKSFPKIAVSILLSICFSFVSLDSAFSQEEKVRAKIGVQIVCGDLSKRAKSKDRLKAGALIRIFVHPEKSSHVYVVHTDHSQAQLLTSVQQKVQSTTLVMPSLQEYYQVDGKSTKEGFTIVCSPDELSEIQAVFEAGPVTHSQWATVENKLLERGKIQLDEQGDTPFALAGNVRGCTNMKGVDPFVKELQILSGKSILVKKFDFRVKK